MTVRMKCAVVLALVAAWGAAGARAQEKRGPSTPEERARFVEITHKLEASPLDKSLIPDREWALRWLIDVPDVSVKVSSDAYQAILKDDPKAKSKELDKLVDKMSKGEPLLQP
jgi:hypothetical protein